MFYHLVILSSVSFLKSSFCSCFQPVWTDDVFAGCFLNQGHHHFYKLLPHIGEEFFRCAYSSEAL